MAFPGLVVFSDNAVMIGAAAPLSCQKVFTREDAVESTDRGKIIESIVELRGVVTNLVKPRIVIRGMSSEPEGYLDKRIPDAE